MKKSNIENAMQQRLAGELSYEQFVGQVVSAGAEYLSHEHHQNVCTFHNNNTYFSYALPYEVSTVVAGSLDTSILIKAIRALDDNNITPE